MSLLWRIAKLRSGLYAIAWEKSKGFLSECNRRILPALIFEIREVSLYFSVFKLISF
ncbi:hypothetical protein KsCSTR_15830 [Candidatus Kuenenia stuttgartiensis]|uniref:Uncharacterized protein n=1 Tax=Kuenenia stuttgartiensis TaxID=174633 RepID=Q1Q1Q6_KUEST|nr:hypothetical protein KsCSTR_15830 [Candidatus Kuenenia stuttgartiensis]CAJ73941.1 unknown protein [Candidatus Kuenenia stuttgartiensis]